uniref:Uncharacterized protein n=1 Tax=viral metagenome TaxID=1070528 RepID=A0A6C0C9A5_9ZZZZ
MLFVLFLFFAGISGRFIQINKDVTNITNVNPAVFIDPGFANAHLNNLSTTTGSAAMTADFHTWLLLTWGIDITTGTYNPFTTGYDFSFCNIFPTTLIDPTDVVFRDSQNPGRIFGNWFVSSSAWFVAFNTSFVVSSGTNAGAVIDNLSALIYGDTYYLKDNSNWSFGFNKETQRCRTDVTAKFFSNMFIGGGAFGGLDSVIRFQCEDTSTTPTKSCFMSVTNMYTRRSDGTVDETKRSTVTC